MNLESLSWQQELSRAITDPAVLLEHLELPADVLPGALQAHQQFRLKVPPSYLAKIQKGTLQDPLLQQVLPLGIEMQAAPGFSVDPLAEKHVNPIPGLLHKYRSRALLIVTSGCGIHCRYCFRRHFPYEDNRVNQKQWSQALTYIAAHPDIQEVILSGGDPLLAPDHVLAELGCNISAIDHVQTLRIHSRLPALIPQRLNEEFLQWFTGNRLKPVLVTHINHPQEIDQRLINTLQTVRQRGVTLLNQSVLLRGINDSVAILKALSQRLFDAGILPYYLHVLDKVQGAAHFEVNEAEAQSLLQALRYQLSGYLVPRLAKEVAGHPSKVVIA